MQNFIFYLFEKLQGLEVEVTALHSFLRQVSTSGEDKSRSIGAAPIPGSIRGSVNRSREFACSPADRCSGL